MKDVVRECKGVIKAKYTHYRKTNDSVCTIGEGDDSIGRCEAIVVRMEPMRSVLFRIDRIHVTQPFNVKKKEILEYGIR